MKGRAREDGRVREHDHRSPTKAREMNDGIMVIKKKDCRLRRNYISDSDFIPEKKNNALLITRD